MLPASSRSILARSVVPEHEEQAALFKVAQLIGHPALALLFAIPNGGKRHVVTGMKMKREGVKPGVPDICLPYPSQGYHGLFIELKTVSGSASPEQKAWIAALRDQGYRAEVCRGAEAAIVVILDYLGLRG